MFLLLLLFIYPFCRVVLHDPNYLFGSLVSDSHYYFVLAKNWVEHGFVSFDLERPTNGVHPLWFLICSGIYAILKLCLSEPILVFPLLIILLCVLLALLSLFIISKALIQLRPSSVPLLSLFVIGIFGVFSFFFAGWDFVPWDYVDGVEGTIQIFCFSLFVHFLVRERNDANQIFTFKHLFLLAVLGLSRLETFLFGFFLLIGLSLHRKEFSMSLLRPLLGIGALIAIVGIYIGINLFFVGYPFPVSGSVKSTFPELNYHNFQILAGVTPYVLLNLISFDPPTSELAFSLSKVAPPLVAVVLSLSFFIILGVNRDAVTRQDKLWRLLLLSGNLYVCVLCLYNVFFVSFIHHGSWYFSLSAFILHLSFVELLDKDTFYKKLTSYRGFAVVSLFIFFPALLHLGEKQVNRIQHAAKVKYFPVFESREELPESLRESMYFSMEDGILTYYLELRSISGIGLVIDPEGLPFFKDKRPFDYAEIRGVTLLIGSGYLDSKNLVAIQDGEEFDLQVKQKLSQMGMNPGGSFEKVFAPLNGSFVIMRYNSRDSEKLESGSKLYASMPQSNLDRKSEIEILDDEDSLSADIYQQKVVRLYRGFLSDFSSS